MLRKHKACRLSPELAKRVAESGISYTVLVEKALTEYLDKIAKNGKK